MCINKSNQLNTPNFSNKFAWWFVNKDFKY
jgi:hypothetical protein